MSEGKEDLLSRKEQQMKEAIITELRQKGYSDDYIEGFLETFGFTSYVKTSYPK